MKYRVLLTRNATKDLKHYLLSAPKALRVKAHALLELVSTRPLDASPQFEALQGDLTGLYSRKLNRHHRMVYEVNQQERWVKVVSLWTHNE